MNRKVESYSISRIGEIILSWVDDEVMVKTVEKGLRRVYNNLSSNFIKNDKIEENKENLINKK